MVSMTSDWPETPIAHLLAAPPCIGQGKKRTAKKSARKETRQTTIQSNPFAHTCRSDDVS